MEFTSIPSLKQKASRIGLGTWAIGGWMWGGTEKQEAIATILQALDAGINLIDTAPVYGFGRAEDIVGQALRQHGRRDKIIIATKGGMSWKNEKVYRDARKETLTKEIHSSLRRLKVDYIDLYQVHWPDERTAISETAEAMDSFLKEGKIRAIGVSNYSIEQMEVFQKHAPLHVLQSPYNLFEREIETKELDYCLQRTISTLGYGSLCRGLLSGRMHKETVFKGDDLRKVDPKFKQPRYSQYLKAVGQLQQWAEHKHNRSVRALAVRFALDKGISVALWGGRKPEQMKGLDAVFGWTLTQQDFEEIDQILKKAISSPIGPDFMAPPNR